MPKFEFVFPLKACGTYCIGITLVVVLKYQSLNKLLRNREIIFKKLLIPSPEQVSTYVCSKRDSESKDI